MRTRRPSVSPKPFAIRTPDNASPIASRWARLTTFRLTRPWARSIAAACVAWTTYTGLSPSWIAPVPSWLLQLAYIGIGLSVGLRFTIASLRVAARILPATLAMIALLLLVSAGLGLLLVPLTGVGALDAYLATTPGGLYAVLAAATTSDVNTTFVLSVQVLRLFVMLLAAPLLARWLAGRDGLRRPAG